MANEDQKEKKDLSEDFSKLKIKSNKNERIANKINGFVGRNDKLNLLFDICDKNIFDKKLREKGFTIRWYTPKDKSNAPMQLVSKKNKKEIQVSTKFFNDLKLQDLIQELTEFLETIQNDQTDRTVIPKNTDKEDKDIDSSDEKINFVGDNESLTKLFNELDDEIFEGKHQEHKVKVCWAPNLNSVRVKIVRDAVKITQIRLSTDSFKNKNINELKELLINTMGKSFTEIKHKEKAIKTMEQNFPDIKSEETNDLFNESSLSKLKFPVRFRTPEEVRAIEMESLGDERLEQLDPNPDIQVLFKEYDQRFFNGLLSFNEVELSYSDKMTKSVGYCYQKTDERPILITLSRRILTMNSRKFIVETLIHEMIHAWLLIREIYEGADGHGPIWTAKAKEISEQCNINIRRFHACLPVSDRDFMNAVLNRRIGKILEIKAIKDIDKTDEIVMKNDKECNNKKHGD